MTFLKSAPRLTILRSPNTESSSVLSGEHRHPFNLPAVNISNLATDQHQPIGIVMNPVHRHYHPIKGFSRQRRITRCKPSVTCTSPSVSSSLSSFRIASMVSTLEPPLNARLPGSIPVENRTKMNMSERRSRLALAPAPATCSRQCPGPGGRGTTLPCEPQPAANQTP